MSPPIFRPLKPEKPLILYLALEKEAIGSMLAQEDDSGVEHIYHLLLEQEDVVRLMSRSITRWSRHV